jgi:hypothetical protein
LISHAPLQIEFTALPDKLTACESASFSWTGGRAPYTLMCPCLSLSRSPSCLTNLRLLQSWPSTRLELSSSTPLARRPTRGTLTSLPVSGLDFTASACVLTCCVRQGLPCISTSSEQTFMSTRLHRSVRRCMSTKEQLNPGELSPSSFRAVHARAHSRTDQRPRRERERVDLVPSSSNRLVGPCRISLCPTGTNSPSRLPAPSPRAGSPLKNQPAPRSPPGTDLPSSRE